MSKNRKRKKKRKKPPPQESKIFSGWFEAKDCLPVRCQQPAKKSPNISSLSPHKVTRCHFYIYFNCSAFILLSFKWVKHLNVDFFFFFPVWSKLVLSMFFILMKSPTTPGEHSRRSQAVAPKGCSTGFRGSTALIPGSWQMPCCSCLVPS